MGMNSAAKDWDRSFCAPLTSCLAFLRRNPEARARAYRLFRRSLLRRFPDAVFYAVAGAQGVIVLVAHGVRDTDWRQEQLDERADESA